MAKISALDRANERVKDQRQTIKLWQAQFAVERETTQMLRETSAQHERELEHRRHELRVLRATHDALSAYEQELRQERDDLLARCSAYHAALCRLAAIYFPLQASQAPQQTGQNVLRSYPGDGRAVTDGAEQV